MKKIIILNLIGGCLAASGVHASVVIFDLRDLSSTTAVESGLLEVGGVSMSISSAQGVLNQTTSAFGVNHGLSGDDTDQIDGGAGESEVVLFSFDQAGVLDQLTMSAFGASDVFDLKMNGASILAMVDQGAVDDFFPAVSFTSTDVFSLEHAAGNGASFDQVTITTVPEPTSLGLCSLGGLVLLLRRRR